MGAGKSALIVEDDPDLLEIISVLLSSQGLRVIRAVDGERGLLLAAADPPDIAILDVHLPGIHGPEVCRRLREFSDAPVLFLTAATEEADELTGFAVGGDDYVHKPFTPRLLTARVMALLRRGKTGSGQPPAVVRAANVSIDLDAMLVAVDGEELELSRTEYGLLAALAASPGRILSRQRLLEGVWGQWYGDDHVIDVTLSRLRGKLSASGAPPKLITTHRGLGYRLNP